MSDYADWPRGAAIFAAILWGTTSLCGCSDATQGTVQGSVTWQGAPLAEGEVRFVPSDGKGQTAAALVTDGTFAITLPIGPRRVEFNAPKVVGKQKMYNTPDSPVVDTVVELLPPRYNVQSGLSWDVKAGVQDAQFDLVEQK